MAQGMQSLERNARSGTLARLTEGRTTYLKKPLMGVFPAHTDWVDVAPLRDDSRPSGRVTFEITDTSDVVGPWVFLRLNLTLTQGTAQPFGAADVGTLVPSWNVAHMIDEVRVRYASHEIQRFRGDEIDLWERQQLITTDNQQMAQDVYRCYPFTAAGVAAMNATWAGSITTNAAATLCHIPIPLFFSASGGDQSKTLYERLLHGNRITVEITFNPALGFVEPQWTTDVGAAGPYGAITWTPGFTIADPVLMMQHSRVTAAEGRLLAMQVKQSPGETIRWLVGEYERLENVIMDDADTQEVIQLRNLQHAGTCLRVLQRRPNAVAGTEFWNSPETTATPNWPIGRGWLFPWGPLPLAVATVTGIEGVAGPVGDLLLNANCTRAANELTSFEMTDGQIRIKELMQIPFLLSFVRTQDIPHADVDFLGDVLTIPFGRGSSWDLDVVTGGHAWDESHAPTLTFNRAAAGAADIRFDILSYTPVHIDFQPGTGLMREEIL